MYNFPIHACWKYTRETDWYHPSSQTTGTKPCKPSSTKENNNNNNKKTKQKTPPTTCLKKKKKNTSRKFQKKIIRDTSFPGSGLALFSVSGNTGIFPKTKAHCDIFKGSSRSPWLKPAEWCCNSNVLKLRHQEPLLF